MLPYVFRGGRSKNSSTTTSTLEEAVHQDLRTIVLPMYIQRLQEVQAEETTVFSCFTQVFQTAKLALLLRYPAHLKPSKTAPLYGCVPVRCNQSAYVQWIYSIISHRIISTFQLQSVVKSSGGTSCSKPLANETDWWSEVSLYVFILYAFYQIATTEEAPPWDGQSKSEEEEKDQQARSYLPMGLQSNENPKILYRRSYPQNNRIRCNVELYSTLLQLQNRCYAYCSSSFTTESPALHHLIATDLSHIVHRLLNQNALELCAYLGPCSLEGYSAGIGENHTSTIYRTAVEEPSMASNGECGDDNDHGNESEGDLGDSSLVTELLQDYIKLREPLLLESSPMVAAPYDTHDPHRTNPVRTSSTGDSDALVQLLQFYTRDPNEPDPQEKDCVMENASPSVLEQPAPSNIPHDIDLRDVAMERNRIVADVHECDDHSICSTWTNGTGVGQGALAHLFSAAQKPQQSTVTTRNIQQYGDFFLNQAGTSTNERIPNKRKAREIGRRNRDATAETAPVDFDDQDDADHSLFSTWTNGTGIGQSALGQLLSKVDPGTAQFPKKGIPKARNQSRSALRKESLNHCLDSDKEPSDASDSLFSESDYDSESSASFSSSNNDSVFPSTGKLLLSNLLSMVDRGTNLEESEI